MMNIDELRQNLLAEAKDSPMLFSDLAGLEEYVSESYNCRSFIELLQNADDAGAHNFFVARYGDFLFVANDGRPFSIEDVESLCRSASSKKYRGQTIGYRGIGFKSVVSFAKTVCLFSGDFEIVFSKEMTKQLIPHVSRVPLVRIPHPIPNDMKQVLSNEIEVLRAKGYNTIFVFQGVITNQIEDEYTSFACTTLLFLNHIRNVQIQLYKNVCAKIQREEVLENKRCVRIDANDAESQWIVFSDNGCSIVFLIEKGKIVKLPREQAIIHAFLPTEDQCGLGVIINGDFSTDPSRRHLIFDEATNEVIKNIVSLYGNLLKCELLDSSQNDIGLVSALVPYYDVNLVHFGKQSFEKDFSNKLCEGIKKFLSTIKLCPNWFNAHDYFKISEKAITTIVPDYYDVKGLIELLKFLGGKVDDIESVICRIGEKQISIAGYSQIVSAGIKGILLNQSVDGFASTPLVLSEGKLMSLQRINDLNLEIDGSFLQLIYDNGVGKNDMELCMKKLSLSNLQKKFIENEERKLALDDQGTKVHKAMNSIEEWFNNSNGKPQDAKTYNSVRRWRSAEENTLGVLNQNGFHLNDVSAQNVGYDLEGQDPFGNDIYIEVKSIDFPGQKFRMTNNEFAAAQFKGQNYCIAVVLQAVESIQIGLIRNPINCLELNRQCVQWVWECANYEFKPMTFEIK